MSALTFGCAYIPKLSLCFHTEFHSFALPNYCEPIFQSVDVLEPIKCFTLSGLVKTLHTFAGIEWIKMLALTELFCIFCSIFKLVLLDCVNAAKANEMQIVKSLIM